MNKQIMKVAGVIMACTLLIGGSTTVLAKDAKGNKAQNFKVSATQKADTKCRALTQEQKDKMLADLKTKLDADVAAGKITQEKADEIYNNAVNCDFRPMGRMRGECPIDNITE